MTDLVDGLEALEPFTRLDRSLLWSINSDYWRAQGHRAFLRDGVPYYATSDGTMSGALARFIADWSGIAAVQQLTLVEIGPGSGLFARCALLHYQALRGQHPGLPPLRYVAVDVAASMVDAMLAHGVMPVDGVEFVFAEIDVGRQLDRLTTLLRDERDRGAHVVVAANYAIDCLPLRHFRNRGGDLQELHVAALRRADSAGSDLRPVTLRQRFVPADAADPIVQLAAEFVQADGAELTINSAALDCIGAIIAALGPRGLFIINDYAGASGEGGEQPWQNFGGSVAAGLHFGAIDRFIAAAGACVTAPDGELSLVTRLAGYQDDATQIAFRRAFSMADARYAHGRAAAARRAQAAGQTDAALAAYESALAVQPDNWSLRLEAAGFLVNQSRNLAAARGLLADVLAANPIALAAMNLMGDCDFADGAIDAAAQWYHNAERVAGGDARARLNLAYCAARQERLEEALGWIARALVSDRGGALTSEILERQNEIIARLAGSLPPS